MSRRRPSRSTRKKLWRLLGFSTPREHRLDREVRYREMAPFTRAMEQFARTMRDIFAEVVRMGRAISSLLTSLGKDQPHAFS